MKTAKIALIGLGEVGRVLAEDLGVRDGNELAAWDVLFADADSVPSRNAARLGLQRTASAADAAAGAGLVISAVTAARDREAAEAAAAGLEEGAWYLDLNSASPGQKKEAAQAIEAAGGRYVEASVMSPIEPKRINAPILLGGPNARAFAGVAGGLGFSGVSFCSDVLGKASATKLCRSVMIKGVEALVAESMLAARAWGVEQDVLASLSNLLPSDDWEKLATYMLSRSIEHGARRAEEMREAARTVEETGIEPLMASATALRQDWAAAHKDALTEENLGRMVDAIRATLAQG